MNSERIQRLTIAHEIQVQNYANRARGVEIVSNDESVAETLIKAQKKGKQVFANCKLKRTVMATCKPFGNGWKLVTGTHEPEAA
jgi:hypothetical protein